MVKLAVQNKNREANYLVVKVNDFSKLKIMILGFVLLRTHLVKHTTISIDKRPKFFHIT